MPNSYGVTTHRCVCGQKLPATFFLNRGRLAARCPACHAALAREHVESKRLFLPVMGGPSAGKTAFLYSAVKQFIILKAPNLGFEAAFFDPRSKSAFQGAISLLKAGRAPLKTNNLIPTALNLTLSKRGRLKFLLYFYDPAGEAYQMADMLAGHGFHEYLSGMILIVDPFAIEAVRVRYQSELLSHWKLLNPCELPIEETIDRLLLTLTDNFGLSKTGKVKQPLAVVLNKVDAFDLETLVGETAVDRALASMASRNARRTLKRHEVRNQLVSAQLAAWGEKAFVRRIEARFGHYRYFSCSALGRMADGRPKPLQGRGVLEPLMWILGRSEAGSFPPGC
jgi:hypothetical protein